MLAQGSGTTHGLCGSWKLDQMKNGRPEPCAASMAAMVSSAVQRELWS